MTDSGGARARAMGEAAAVSQMYAFPGQTVRNPDASAPQNDAKRRRLTGRQEKFCEEYVLWGNGAMAASFAGYSEHSARKQAYRLLTNAYIQEHIAEMRRDLGAGNRIGLDTLLAKLEACFRKALRTGKPSAAVRAAEAQARLAGLMPGRLAPRDAAGQTGETAAPGGGEPSPGRAAPMAEG